jgi:hypothetical protein
MSTIDYFLNPFLPFFLLPERSGGWSCKLKQALTLLWKARAPRSETNDDINDSMIATRAPCRWLSSNRLWLVNFGFLSLMVMITGSELLFLCTHFAWNHAKMPIK